VAGLETLIRVESERQVIKAQVIEISTETRYYISSKSNGVSWQTDSGVLGVDKVHYVRVTQGRMLLGFVQLL